MFRSTLMISVPSVISTQTGRIASGSRHGRPNGGA
jgi:hypothetical protein